MRSPIRLVAANAEPSSYSLWWLTLPLSEKAVTIEGAAIAGSAAPPRTEATAAACPPPSAAPAPADTTAASPLPTEWPPPGTARGFGTKALMVLPLPLLSAACGCADTPVLGGPRGAAEAAISAEIEPGGRPSEMERCCCCCPIAASLGELFFREATAAPNTAVGMPSTELSADPHVTSRRRASPSSPAAPPPPPRPGDSKGDSDEAPVRIGRGSKLSIASAPPFTSPLPVVLLLLFLLRLPIDKLPPTLRSAGDVEATASPSLSLAGPMSSRAPFGGSSTWPMSDTGAPASLSLLPALLPPAAALWLLSDDCIRSATLALCGAGLCAALLLW